MDGGSRVFVYGSLLDSDSLLATLAHRSAPPSVQPFVLEGWARTWDVVSARTFAVADDPAGRTQRRVVLGLERRHGARCEGLVLDLTDRDLEALAVREQAYRREAVTTDGLGPIEAFVPLDHRRIGARPVAEPLVVERAYLDRCLAGAASHGLAEAAAELRAGTAGLRVVSPAD